MGILGRNAEDAYDYSGYTIPIWMLEKLVKEWHSRGVDLSKSLDRQTAEQGYTMMNCASELKRLYKNNHYK